MARRTRETVGAVEGAVASVARNIVAWDGKLMHHTFTYTGGTGWSLACGLDTAWAAPQAVANAVPTCLWCITGIRR